MIGNKIAGSKASLNGSSRKSNSISGQALVSHKE
jgi:hypothetical protein